MTQSNASEPRSVVRFGVSGWDYRDWFGPLYPKPAPKGFRALPLLAQFLDFMEVNATFYHPMGGTVSERWLDETPTAFTFLVKAWQGWTHRDRPPTGPELLQFREVMDPILSQNRLEGILLQFPPSWRDEPRRREQVLRLRDALAPARVFVEVRHRSLYQPEFLSFLAEERVDFVNVDLPAVGQLPGPSTINTGPTSFLRLHGRNAPAWKSARATRDERYDYRYSEAEVEELLDTIRRLVARTPRVLVAANNHFAANAPAAAALLRSGWEQRKVEVPSRLIESHPELQQRCTALPDDTPPAPRNLEFDL